MKFQYLGKEVQSKVATLKETIHTLAQEDDDFRITFLENDGRLKWNCIVIKNDSMVDVDKEIQSDLVLSDNDEFFLMLQLSGG